jgi:hypothetical protein
MLDDAHFGFLLLQSKHTLKLKLGMNVYLIFGLLEESVKNSVSFLVRHVLLVTHY